MNISCRSWVSLVQLVVALQTAAGLHILGIQVPRTALSGEAVELKCYIKLDRDSLYSLTWWRDDQQFYQYSPAMSPPKRQFDVPGIVINMHESGLENVVLARVDHRASGELRCEAVSEQSFEKDSKASNFTVIDLPVRAPKITGRTSGYTVGDLLLLNCTSPASHPPATHHWHINGRQASTETVIKFPGREDGYGRTSSSSGLQMFLRPQHFMKGALVIGCAARVLHLRDQLAEEIIMDARHPVEAPKSQFSEGRSYGLTITGCEHPPLLLLALLLLWYTGT
ncbi:uncharacterized protein LOC125178126 [Hyalella azteca]|uniref:Uncharacterized protein LOC125178126 n=1 Tax=Hyalella azteca TaxID=294128 RepID=A0A979FLR4_HYAAZ|nr:uncharacterized protein LOC125178126 [Hyalella azteca]